MKKITANLLVLTSSLILFTFLAFDLSCQIAGINYSLISMPSPNVASLGIYGQFPAALPTGVPNITIPIYELNYGGIKIPLTLRYNPQLLKPDLHPGWVGLGWDITNGGSITRVVNDLDDEMSSYGYYYKFNSFQGDDWSSIERIKSVAVSTHYDTRPDEFSFSFLGYSGTFYLDENRNWKVRSDQKIDVLIDNSSIVQNPENYNLREFRKFILIDSHGIKYIFGGDTTNIEYTAGLFEYSNFHAKTWFLSKIQTPDERVIDFIYERGTILLSPQLNWFDRDWGLSFSGSQIKPSYLKEIKSPIYSVKFQRSLSDELRFKKEKFNDYFLRCDYNIVMGDFTPCVGIGLSYNMQKNIDNHPFSKLDRITIESIIDSKLIEQIEFGYNNLPTERLKLKKIVSISCKEWALQYTDDLDPALKMPDYFSNQLDFWGYYNGRTGDYSTYESFLASKEIDQQKLQCELLSKVIYPTKGYTKYVFETHDYSKSVADLRYNPLITNSSNSYASGLRIKSAANFNFGDGLINSINYYYTSGYEPSGPTTKVKAYQDGKHYGKG
jgi:hypothetical protein